MSHAWLVMMPCWVVARAASDGPVVRRKGTVCVHWSSAEQTLLRFRVPAPPSPSSPPPPRRRPFWTCYGSARGTAQHPGRGPQSSP
eukprot:576479-Rhodomonas_salina.1